MNEAIEILRAFLKQLPQGHPDAIGVRRAIEVLQGEQRKRTPS